jgi:diketogulonate reductase-like aldo/keto reductase
MLERRLGANGPGVPVVGQGTWNMERDDRRSAVAAIQRGIDLGMRHIDTAEMYGSGRVEQIVAEATAGRRGEVFLATKVLPQNASFAGTLRACEASLKRLRTDHVDLYLLHWPGSHPLEETLRAFEKLTGDGKIRHYGVSNFDASEVSRAVALAGAGKITCNQVLYHLEERGIEHEVLPACEKLGVAVVAYSPFGQGRFPSPRSRGGRELADLAAARGATPHQIALAFLTRRESLFTIPKASRIQHVEENGGAAKISLSAEEVERLDSAFPLGPRRKGVPTL